MSFSTVAIVGATGTLGKALTHAIVNKGFKVKILTRNTTEAKNKIDVKAEYVQVDYTNKNSLVSALRGVQVVVSAIAGPALNDQLLLIEAAKEANVTRFYPSEFGADPANGGKVILFDTKDKVFKALQESGIEWTFVTNGLFLEYLYSPFFGFDIPNHKANLVGTKDTLISFTPLKAIGEYVAESINNPISKNAVISVAGETKTFGEIIALVEQKTGHKWEVIYTPISQVQAKIDANPNKWETVVDQLLVLFGKSQGIIKKPQNKEFANVKPVTLVETIS